MKSKTNLNLFVFCLIIGLFLTWNILGSDNFNSANLNWISSYDLKSDYLAYKFFINDKWRFPLGLNPNYGEITNSIVFSGAVPILSFIFKTFKFLLPENYHFFSFWIIICISLQLFFSIKIFNLFSKDYKISVICGLFLITIPFFYYRLSIHLSLGAHWIIIGYLYYELKKNTKRENSKIILILLSSLIHFYLTIMLLLMRFIFEFNEYFKGKKLNEIFKENSVLLVLLFSLMYVSGYFVLPSTDTLGYGFGIYKANFLTLFDPIPNGSLQIWSMFIPDIKNNTGEHEGFSYIGLGGIILLIFLIYYCTNHFNLVLKNKKYIYLIILFLILSLSNNIGFGNREIISVNLPNILYAPLSVIRASGRFIWIVSYLIIIFSLIALIKYKLKKRYFLTILLIQLIDTSYLFKSDLFENQKKQNFLIENYKLFQENEYNRLITTYPTDNSSIFYKVANLLMSKDFQSTNMFRLGRYDRSELSNNRNLLNKELNYQIIDFNSLYFIENHDHLRHLKFKFQKSDHGFFNTNDSIWFLAPKKKNLMDTNDIKKFESIKFFKTKTKQKKQIIFKDQDGLLGLGWSHGSYGKGIDTNGAWTEGNESFLIFENKIDNIEKIIIEVTKVMSSKSKPLKVDVYINSELVDQFNLFDEKQNIELRVNKILKNGLNEIKFHTKNPIRPVSRLESVDGRLLGFKIINISFI